MLFASACTTATQRIFVVLVHLGTTAFTEAAGMYGASDHGHTLSSYYAKRVAKLTAQNDLEGLSLALLLGWRQCGGAVASGSRSRADGAYSDILLCRKRG